MSGAAATAPNYAVDPAYSRTPPPALLNQIEELQQDGRLLLDHLTKQPGRRFAAIPAPASANSPNGAASPAAPNPAPPQGQTGINAAGKIDELSLEPLRLSSAEIAAHKELFSGLVLLVDALARLADPVTPKTIRRSGSWYSRYADFFLLIVLVIGFGLSISLIWRVDEARTLMTQVQQAQTASKAVYRSLRLLKPEENFLEVSVPAAGASGQSSANGILPFCDLGLTRSHLRPKTPEAEGLCSELAEKKTREEILFHRLRGWNCNLTTDLVTAWIRPLVTQQNVGGLNSPDFNYAPCIEVKKPKDCAAEEIKCSEFYINRHNEMLRHWQQSEFRTATIVSLMANHLLPSLLALVGACTYLLRLRIRQRAGSMLEEFGLWAGFARLLMPAALGGLLSIVFGSGDGINPTTVKLQELSLSLAVAAFLFGYAFDPILEWLEGKIRDTFLKLNGDMQEVKVK